MRKILSGSILAVTLIGMATPAFAYLDPGTGSMILQGLIAGVAAAATVISLYYQRFKAKLASLFGKKDDTASK